MLQNVTKTKKVHKVSKRNNSDDSVMIITGFCSYDLLLKRRTARANIRVYASLIPIFLFTLFIPLSVSLIFTFFVHTIFQVKFLFSFYFQWLLISSLISIFFLSNFRLHVYLYIIVFIVSKNCYFLFFHTSFSFSIISLSSFLSSDPTLAPWRYPDISRYARVG